MWGHFLWALRIKIGKRSAFRENICVQSYNTTDTPKTRTNRIVTAYISAAAAPALLLLHARTSAAATVALPADVPYDDFPIRLAAMLRTAGVPCVSNSRTIAHRAALSRRAVPHTSFCPVCCFPPHYRPPLSYSPRLSPRLA